MKILKINYYNTKNNNINFQSKPVLTKKIIQPKIDLFCRSVEIKEVVMSDFIKLRESFAEKLYPIFKKSNIAEWNFYINSNDENFNIMSELSDELEKIWQNEVLYKEFLNIDKTKLSKHEQKQLKNIIKNFEEELNSGEELKLLRDKENEIAKKYNSYIPKIDGKETTKTEINKIFETEKNPEIRKKAYEANIKGGNLIAEDLKELVKLRNNYAKKEGYSNYFEYKLKETYKVDLNELENLLDNIYLQAKNLIKIKINKNKKELAEFFGLNEKDLKSYHYGYLTENNPEKKLMII